MSNELRLVIGWNNLAPLFQPIRRNIKISRDLVAREFPRLPPASPALSSDWFPQRRPPSPPLPLPGSTLGKSAFRNSTQRSDTTINYRTKKEKNKQNIAVLAWPKNTLFSSTVKYWTPLTTINVQFQHCWALHIPYLLHISCHSRLWHQHHCDLKTLEQTAPTRSWTGQNVPRFPVETRHHCHRRCKEKDLKHQLRHPSGKCSCRLE